MDNLTLIRKPIEQELEHFGEMFDVSLSAANETLHKVYAHLLKRKGKMMRPTLLMLLAKEFGGVNEAAYHAALSLELLHTASLIHDDVVDDSTERRGQLSVNALFTNKIAILSGDYMLSTALHHASLTGSVRIVEAISALGKDLSEGELLQLYNIAATDLSEERYTDIIAKKTASLFVTCTRCAALSCGVDENMLAKCEEFGRLLGLAFQVRDDIFDYFDNAEIGKPTANDMFEHKITLPAIYALKSCPDEEMMTCARRVKAGEATVEEIARLVDFTKQHGGIDYAERVMEEYIERAVSLLSFVRNSDIREALSAYAEYIGKRTY